MDNSAITIFMVIASTYFMAKIVYLIYENFRRENTKIKFHKFLETLEEQSKKKGKK